MENSCKWKKSISYIKNTFKIDSPIMRSLATLQIFVTIEISIFKHEVVIDDKPFFLSVFKI